jgi:hypothetical protein
MYNRHGRRAAVYTVWVTLYSTGRTRSSLNSLFFWFNQKGNFLQWISLVVSLVFALAWWFIIFVEIVNYVKKEHGKEEKTDNV